MRSVLQAFETRLTKNRLGAASFYAFMMFAVFVAPLLTEPDAQMRNPTGQIYGHDFGPFWVAGRVSLEQGPAAPWDRATFEAAMAQYYPGYAQPNTRFNYPPPALLAIVPLSSLPLSLAFPMMMAGGILLCLYALWRIVPEWRTLVVALGAPILFQVVVYGQWSYWFAGLMGLALLPVARQQGPAPWACALFIMKPTLGLILPFACLRTASGLRNGLLTIVFAVILLVASLIIFGSESWQSYLTVLPEAHRFLIGGLNELNAHSTTLGSALQIFGVSAEIARLAQYVWAIAVCGVIVAIMKSDARGDLKAACIASGTVIAVPYMMLYDLAILAPAAAFYIRDARVHGYRTGDLTLLLLCAIVPLFGREIQDEYMVPVGFLVSFAMFSMVATRAFASAAENQTSTQCNEQKTESVIPTKRLLQHEY